MWLTVILASLAIVLVSADDGNFQREAGPLKVYVACGFHGREWATVELCKAMREEVNRRRAAATNANPFWTDWYFDVDVNPDGTRAARLEGGECQRGNSRGVDLNRNFPPIERCPSGLPPARPPFMRFVGRDAEDYPGERPLSEYETRLVVEHMREYNPDVALFIHTGTTGIMLPYDSCFEPTPGQYNLMMTEFASKMSEVLNLKKERIGRSTTRLHPGVGTAADYAFAELGIPFTFTVETYEMPLACEGASTLLRKPTNKLSLRECKKVFVPHSASDNCRNPNIEAYIERWVKLVDAVEYVVAANANERYYLGKWLEKSLVPQSAIDRQARLAEDQDYENEPGLPPELIQPGSPPPKW